MTLYFRNHKGEDREIGNPENKEQAWQMILDFCEARSYEIPYCRIWQEDSSTYYDVGSHTEFFILKKNE